MSKTQAHPRPAPPAGHARVRSCLVSREMLREWGFEVAACPASHELHKGEELAKAMHAAWALGWVEFSSHQDHERVWVGRGKVSAEERAEGLKLLAWFEAEGRVRR